jgi:hypothetical protein
MHANLFVFTCGSLESEDQVVWQQVSLWTGLQVCVFEDWVSLSPVGAGRDFECLDCGEHLTISYMLPQA